MTVYFVDGVDGNDGNAGTSEGAGNAWATIDFAASTVSAADKVWIKGNGDYVENVVLDTAGSSGNEIVYEGYTATTGDNGIATIAPTSGIGISASARAYQVFKNLKLDGSGGGTIGYSAGGDDNLAFINCEFTGWSSDGCLVDNWCLFVLCSFNNNGADGCDSDQTCAFYGCVSHSNTQLAFRLNDAGAMVNCLSYNMGSNDIGIFLSCTTPNMVVNCTVDGENGASTIGINVAGNSHHLIANTIIYDCNVGIAESSTSLFTANLHFNSNGTDITGTRDDIGDGDQSTAPAFTSEATDDYTLDSASDAIDAGLNPRVA